MLNITHHTGYACMCEGVALCPEKHYCSINQPPSGRVLRLEYRNILKFSTYRILQGDTVQSEVAKVSKCRGEAILGVREVCVQKIISHCTTTFFF